MDMAPSSSSIISTMLESGTGDDLAGDGEAAKMAAAKVAARAIVVVIRKGYRTDCIFFP